MIRVATLGLAALAGAVPALAAEGGPIRSGEHDGFSRLVLQIEAATEWSLETAGGRVVLMVPGKRLDFGVEGVFELIPRDRIRDVRASADDRGTRVELELGCDCRVSTTFVGGRWLALDVADRGKAPQPTAAASPAPGSAYGPAPEDPAARDERESSAVASAEQILIEQIERAASQGLIRLSPAAPTAAPGPGDDAVLPEVEPPEAPPPPEVTALPVLPSPWDAHGVAHEENLPGLLEHEQIEAITVFDRDSGDVAARLREAAVAAACIPDARLDLAGWSNGAPFFEQAAALSGQLVGEFDRPDADALVALVRLHVRFGLGAEAEWLLDGFPAAVSDQALLADLARASEGRPVASEGPLATAAPCPGRHGLWLAVAGAAPAFHDPAHFAGVHAAFSELPPDLRAMLGAGLVGRLVDAGRPAEARLILETAQRPGLAQSADIRLAAGRLTAAEGDPEAAVRALGELVDDNTYNATEALTGMVRLAVDAGVAIPGRRITDVQAAALQQRRTPREAELRGLLAEALAQDGQLGAAVAEVRAARHDLPEAAAGFDTLGIGILLAADPERVGGAAYAEVMLAANDLLGLAAAGDPARTAIAAHLLRLGLPEAALTTVDPAARRGVEAARRIAAEAHLRLGHGDRARAALAGLGGPGAAELRARAFAMQGDFDRAMAALDAEGLSNRAAAYAWSSGDWPRARDAAADPGRLAMASFMAARGGSAENPGPAPADDASADDAAQAFREPLPLVDPPSLGAARRLLANGRQVGGFVQGLLETE